MATVIRISSQGQIRIPKKIMETMGIGAGDYFEVGVEGAQVVLKPRKLIDPTQGWYWTPGWQAMESEADQDIAAGRYRDFDTVEDLLQDMHGED
jgi:AbrB family looped-hinge helix DNA binding protein